MSASHINPVTVLAAIRKGFTSRGELEDYFSTEPGDAFLRSALGDTWNRKTGEVAVR